MNKFLIATHGSFASGILSTLKIIVGKVDNLSYVDAFTEGTDLHKDIKNFINSVDTNDTGIIFTDLKGGSVNQQAFKMMNVSKKENLFVITGFNLPILLSLVLGSKQITREDIIGKIQEAKEQIEFLEIEQRDFIKANDTFFD